MAAGVQVLFVGALLSSLSPMQFYNFVLINIIEDMRRIQQDCCCSDRCHEEEEVELQSIDDHCDVLPVLPDLWDKEISGKSAEILLPI